VQSGGELDFVFAFENAGDIYPSTRVRCWLRHLAGHTVGKRFVTVMFDATDGLSRTFQPLEQSEARRQFEELLSKVFEPLPPGHPDFAKVLSRADDLPFDWEHLEEIVGGSKGNGSAVVSTVQEKRGKK